jgi:hypothetical protein
MREAQEVKMDRYRMDDGTIVKPDNATKHWDEGVRWDGNNHVSLATNDQWTHQRLYKTRRGRYWCEHWSQWQGSTPHAEWISEREAVRWLLQNEHDDLPDDLEPFRAEIEE